MKVLISAYACEPDRGSEPGVGWAWAQALSKHVDLTVVTRANNEAVIRQWYEDNGILSAVPEFEYYDLPRLAIWLKRKKLLPVQLYYIFWQMGVAWSMRKTVRNVDIVHHVTFNSMMIPGFWWFSEAPVILGPLGGTSCVSKQYKPLFGRKIWKERIREKLINNWLLLPWVRFSFNQAAAILCANSETLKQISRRYPESAQLMLETGISHFPSTKCQLFADQIPIRFIWIGTIEPWKALSLALNGFAAAVKKLPDGTDIHLDIVGKGSEQNDAEQQVSDLGIGDYVSFHGWVAKTEVDRMLEESRALLFTSIKDTSGNVVLEAMAHRLPVICIDHQGVADMTTDDTAIRIEVASIPSTISGITDAIIKLATQPELAVSLGAAGYERVNGVYAWDQRALKMKQLYMAVTGEAKYSNNN